MRVRVLGPSRLDAAEGDPIDLGARRPRSILAALALRLGTDVPAETLVDLVWGDGAPPGAHGTLHSYISGLRRVLEPDLKPRERPTVLVTTDRGYRLALAAGEVDAPAFADAVRARHRDLSPLAGQLSGGDRSGWPTRAQVSSWVDELEGLLGWWTGEAYADLLDQPEVEAARAGLEQLRLQAEDDRVLGLLALGDHATVVAATEQATARNPLRERTWALHALALTRSGRQADALAALREVRTVLAEELGIDPGQELRDLEQAVLVQDPRLLDRLGEEGTSLPAPAPAPAQAHSWATVGRAPEEAALRDVLRRAEDGDPACALLVGEAGIGKTRLVEALTTEAEAAGFVVALGRCSSDDGAPPLWPWAGIMRALAAADGTTLDGRVEAVLSGVTGTATDATEEAFRAWDLLAVEVTERARRRPVLVVLEDLHWADATSLRALAHLLHVTQARDRLAVLASARPGAGSSPAAAEVGEALARRHVTRLDLTALSAEDARALVSAVRGSDVPQGTADDWRTQSGGNPFFLVELARADVAVTTGAVPTTVRDVVLARVGALPEPTQELLLDAAVLGRRFSPEVLARVADRDVEDVDDALQPARDAGLVVDSEDGIVSFAHALTRDAVAGSTTPLRLARRHARVAHVLEHDAGVRPLVPPEERVSELARHWSAAGPSHVGQAWRAAVDAAEQARRTYSHEDAAMLMRRAVEAHRRDPLGTYEEHMDLLMAQARDNQRGANWTAVVDCAFAAIALARQEHDPARMASAAAALTDRGVWLPHGWNQVYDDVVDDLRWGMRELAATDSPERCRLMLALAVELYYDPTAPAELRALVDEGLAIARRLGEPELLVWACRAAWTALWQGRLLPERAALSAEALEAARLTGDQDLVAVSLTNVAADALEAGDRSTYESLAGEARRLAQRRRLRYVSLGLGWVELYLAGMRDDDDWLDGQSAALRTLIPQATVIGQELQLAAAELVGNLWRPERMEPLIDALMEIAAASPEVPAEDLMFLILPRVGRAEDARPLLHRREPHRVQNWSTASYAAELAESAFALGDADLAAAARVDLLPVSGQMCVAGISSMMGPIDGYLALTEAVLGDSASARRHADQAVALAEVWEIPRYTRWLLERRERGGF